METALKGGLPSQGIVIDGESIVIAITDSKIHPDYYINVLSACNELVYFINQVLNFPSIYGCMAVNCYWASEGELNTKPGVQIRLL